MEDGETILAGSAFCFCSAGMMLFNKLAIEAFPYECVLVALQMIFAAAFLVTFTWSSLHIGSLHDLLRWSMVAPLFTTMLLTSILALKAAPMSLVITLRCLTPLGALLVERLYPSPLEINREMIVAIGLMFAGGSVFLSQISHASHLAGVGWVIFNSMVAVAERCLQRYLLSKDQNPVDISKTSCTLINNLLGSVPMLIAAYATGELAQVQAAAPNMSLLTMLYVGLSCVIGLGISYTGVWAQSLISATTFLVLVNSNKFVVIGIEVFVMHTKALTHIQMHGACLTILGACLYGVARQRLEMQQEAEKLLEPEESRSNKVV